MILRTLFWISVVAILMPHEPDLGLGRPNFAGGANLGSHAACSEQGACRKPSGLLDQFQSMAVSNLAEVKADIEREQHRHTDLRTD
jgi:hypothetical protein